MSEVEELDLLIEHRERTAAFLAAKDKAANGGPKAQEAWREQKDKMRAWRRQWREVREAFGASAGTASPDSLGLKTKGN